MATTFPKPNESRRRWVLVDAEGQVLGRLASRIALVLRGKHRPTYTPHLDTGDFVVVINAEKIKLTGQKLMQKVTKSYSGYPGGLKTWTAKEILSRHPERLLEHAVKGMLPHGPLGRRVFGNLKVYAGPRHPHAAQQPQPLGLGHNGGRA